MRKYMGKVSAVFLFFLMAIFWIGTVTYNLRATTLYTKVSTYTNLLVSAAGGENDLIAATGYNVGVPAPGGTLGPVDLRQHSSRGAGSMEANSIVLTCYATCSDNDDVTVSLYGISRLGAPERIGSLLWTFGTAIRSTGIRWADTCVVTDTHITSITVSDSGNNRIVKVMLDTTGYRYVYAIAHTRTTGTATVITIPLRYY